MTKRAPARKRKEQSMWATQDSDGNLSVFASRSDCLEMMALGEKIVRVRLVVVKSKGKR